MTHTTEIAEKKSSSNHLFFFLRSKSDAVASGAVLLLFGIVVFGIYSGTFESPFAFDGSHKILENSSIRLTELSLKKIVMAGLRSSKTRPLAFISFALNYYFNQYDPVGYHIVNIAIHGITGWLLFLFLGATLKLPSQTDRFEYPKLIAFLAAFIWLVHPVQTQSVTYIIQRMNSMASMLFLLAFWCYVKGRMFTRNRQKWMWYIGAAIAWLLSLGCKQITATLPFLVFLYEWYFFQDLSQIWFKRSLKWLLSILVVFFIIVLVYTGFSPLEKLYRFHDFVQNDFTVTQRALTQLRVIAYYISLLFYPHPSRLNLDYDFPLSYSLLNPLTTLLCFIFILGMITIGIFLAKKQRLLSFCIFWFLGNLVIESSVIPLAIIFEHRLYLPSMLFFLPVVILSFRYVRPTQLSIGIICVLIAICAYWTIERNKVWRDAISLWTDSVKKSPNKARPYANLGVAQKQIKMFDAARQNYLKAIQVDPTFFEAYFNLGDLLEEQGNVNEAIEYYRKAIKIKPNYAKAHNQLGIALLEIGKTNEAIAQLRIALEISPNFAKAHNNLGLALSKEGKLDEAIEHYHIALKIDPGLFEGQYNLANALIEQGKTEEGFLHIKKALQIRPDYADAHNNLGGELLRQGKIDEALKHFNAALKTSPDLAEAHNNVGIIMVQKGNLDAAISHFQEALRISPDFEMAKNNLQRALAIRQKTLDAEFQKLLAALADSPDDPMLNYRLGNLYLGRGELDKAVEHFEKALARQPKFAEAQNNLALAYAAGRQYERALAAFKKLLELDPDNSSTCYNIAVLYALQNEVDDAVEWLKKAVDLGYRNWELIKKDKDLANIRRSEGYQQLVEGH